MEIYKINPQGYCNGVKYALDVVEKTLKNPNTVKPIYLLGNLIHNKNVMQSIINKGIIVLDGDTRFNMLDKIKFGTVIFSAHGVSPRVYEKARLKGLHIVDATCPNVLIVHKHIIDYLSKGYEIIYIGTRNHPESEGVVEISDKIHLVSSLSEAKNLSNLGNKIFITNQTTLSIFDINEIYDELRKKYSYAIIDNKICLATTKRQEALINQNGSELCIVVGDKTSSNSKKLVSVSQNIAKIPSYLVETKEDLNPNWFKNVKKVSITSGASTPNEVTAEVIKAIEQMNK